LDGVTVKETGVSVVDGTSPHVFEPSYPGTRDFYVDLSPAWDTGLLEGCKDKIERLSGAKSECYKTAYRLLKAAGTVTNEMYECAKSFVDTVKIKGFVKRFARKYIKQGGAKQKELKKIVVNAISSKGLVRYFTPENAANTLFFVKDAGLVSRFLFEELECEIKKSGADAVLALSPENPNEICAILLKESGVCVSLYDEDMANKLEAQGKSIKIINASRFIDTEKYKSHRQKFRFAAKCRETLFDAALSELSAAGKFHEKLESVYISATDYKKVEEIAGILY
ncbi:MAG: hypothetical protein IJZ20_03175, partial [Clostridia bacterium]|nr:hypothetical protein [Clostridia bacterium]